MINDAKKFADEDAKLPKGSCQGQEIAAEKSAIEGAKLKGKTEEVAAEKSANEELPKGSYHDKDIADENFADEELPKGSCQGQEIAAE